MMDDKQRMAEMEALLRDAVGGWNGTNWQERVNAILAPPPDPDAGAKDALYVFTMARGVILPGHIDEAFRKLDRSAQEGWRAIAAWSDRQIKAARIAALRDALAAVTALVDQAAIRDLLAKAEAPDA